MVRRLAAHIYVISSQLPSHVSSLLCVKWDYFSTCPKKPFRPPVDQIINSLRAGAVALIYTTPEPGASLTALRIINGLTRFYL